MLTRIFPEVPAETARLAHQIFNEQNLYLQVGNNLCAIAGDFSELLCCSNEITSGQAMHLLALITVFQFIERLNDRQANEAIRQRLDWKFALHLPVTFPSAPYLQTCEFRRHLLLHEKEMNAFQALLGRMKRQGLPEGTPVTPTGSLASADHIVRTVCMINRLDRLAETTTAVFEYLATYHTAWLRQHTQPGWLLRYRRGTSLASLPASPDEWPARLEMIGNDGYSLLKAIENYPNHTPEANSLMTASQVKALALEIRRQFVEQDGRLLSRSSSCLDCDTFPSG